MKKLYFFLVALMVGFAANADITEALYLRGSFNEWAANDASKFTKSGDKWVLENVTIPAGAELAIADANWNDTYKYGEWDGYAKNMTGGNKYKCHQGGGNMTFGDTQFTGNVEFWLDGTDGWAYISFVNPSEPETPGTDPETPETPDFSNYYVGIVGFFNSWTNDVGEPMLEVHPDQNGICTWEFADMKGAYFTVRVWPGSGEGYWIVPESNNNRTISNSDWTQAYTTESNIEPNNRQDLSFMIANDLYCSRAILKADVKNNKVQYIPNPFKLHIDFEAPAAWADKNVFVYAWQEGVGDTKVAMKKLGGNSRADNNLWTVSDNISIAPTNILFYTTTNNEIDGVWAEQTQDLEFQDTFVFLAGTKNGDGKYEVSHDNITGIDAIGADSVAPVYYNMQGVRVDNPQSGLYIMVRGNKVSKVLVK